MYCVVPSARRFVRTRPLPDFPSCRAIKHRSIQYGELAQLGERLVCNQEVTGSSPVFSTIVLEVFGRGPNRSLTTEYSANGSFFPTTHTQCAWGLSRAGARS